MKEVKFAIYLGKEYTAGKNKEGKIILRSTDIKDVINGVEPCDPFTFRKGKNKIVCLKVVERAELEDYYTLKKKAVYKGVEFEVVEEMDDKLSIVTMTGDYRDWINLGMRSIDKGVYQKWIGKNEAEVKLVKESL